MVYAHKVNRVTLSGTMWGGAEIWSTGFFLGQKDADANDPTQAAADAIAAAWKTFFENANSQISSSYSFTMAKIAAIDATGHTVLDKVFYAAPLTASVGANGTARLPSQCSLVATLTSARPRGLAAKGRMYLPGWAVAPGTDGLLTVATTVTNVATTLQTFFNAVNASVDVPNSVILAAKGTGLLPALTAQNDWVTGLKIGNVIDTQRRRRNGLNETYVAKTIT